MRTMTIHVTQEHIDRGMPFNCWRCPVALALHEAGFPDKASITHEGIYLSNHILAAPRVRIPDSVKLFMTSFDLYLNTLTVPPAMPLGLKPPEPFSFEIELSDAVEALVFGNG